MSGNSPVRPPALAYFEVADIVPADYLSVPPPETGIRLIIVGDDDLATRWDMDPKLAGDVARVLARRRAGARVTGNYPYDDRKRDPSR